MIGAPQNAEELRQKRRWRCGAQTTSRAKARDQAVERPRPTRRPERSGRARAVAAPREGERAGTGSGSGPEGDGRWTVRLCPGERFRCRLKGEPVHGVAAQGKSVGDVGADPFRPGTRVRRNSSWRRKRTHDPSGSGRRECGSGRFHRQKEGGQARNEVGGVAAEPECCVHIAQHRQRLGNGGLRPVQSPQTAAQQKAMSERTAMRLRAVSSP